MIPFPKLIDFMSNKADKFVFTYDYKEFKMCSGFGEQIVVYGIFDALLCII